MAWWHRFVLHNSDAEIRERVASMVATGEIKPELAPMYERVLRD
jgi:hypothetical protein